MKRNSDHQVDKSNTNVRSQSTSGTGLSSQPAQAPMAKQVCFPMEDRCTPANPEGKKAYDRMFLLDLRNNPASQKKPDGLADLEVCDKGAVVKRTVAPDDIATPPYVKTIPPKDLPKQNSREEVENPNKTFNPKHAIQSKEYDLEKVMTEELSQAVHRILDKLTLFNFERVLSEMQAVTIDTEEGLIGVVKLIVEKAISAPALSWTYAKMCQALSTKGVKSTADPAKTITFRKCLLAVCQREFEKVGDGYKDIVVKENEIEEADNEEEKTQLKESLKELTGRIRRRLHGRMRFIGVLFELKILSARVMHECIELLLSSSENNESLESVCVLLSVVGKELESPGIAGQSALESKLTMNGYFAQLDKILNKRKASNSALTLLIQELMNFRKNNWTSQSGNLPGHRALEMSQAAPIAAPYMPSSPALYYPQQKQPVQNEMLHGEPSATEDEIERKVESILVELFTNESLENAVRELKEWLHPSTVEQFVNQCVMFVLEYNRTGRRATGTLFKEMIKRRLFNSNDIANGFNEVLQCADDFVVYIPRLWENLAEMVEPVFEDGVVNLNFLGQLSSPLGSYATKFVAAILRELVKAQGGAAGAERLWTMSNVSLASVLPPGVDPNVFVSQNGDLDFLVKAPSSPYLDFQRSLQDYLKKSSQLTNDDVCKWVDSQQLVDRHSPAFIRALVTAVTESSIDGHGTESKLIPSTFKERTEVLRRYVENLPDRELQLLFAVQALVTQRQHPKGLIQGIFQALYDSDVVSEEGFESWLASDDPAEREGKAVAIKSVKSFLTWLKEADVESDQDSDVDPITFVNNNKTTNQDERESKIDVLESGSVVRHPIPPGPLGVNRPLAMAGAGHTGPIMQGRPTQGNNQFYNRAPLRPNNMTRPPMGSNAPSHPPNPAPVKPYPGQPLSQPVVVFINDQYNQQPQLFQNPYQYYQTPGNMPPGSVYQPRAAQQPYANYRQAAPLAAPYMPSSPAVYYPQQPQQADQPAPKPVPMGPVSVPGVPPTSQSRESTANSRRARSSAIRLVDPNTNRDVITGEYVPPPPVPVTTSAP